MSGDAQSYAMFLYASDSSSSLRSSPTSSSSSSSSSSSTTSLGSLDKPSPKSSDIGEIVGGVLGGLALLVAILGLLFCVRRRKKEEITMVDPTDYQPVRYSKDPTLVSSDHLGSPHKCKSKISMIKRPFKSFFLSLLLAAILISVMIR